MGFDSVVEHLIQAVVVWLIWFIHPRTVVFIGGMFKVEGFRIRAGAMDKYHQIMAGVIEDHIIRLEGMIQQMGNDV
jgi:hypothetical protein